MFVILILVVLLGGYITYFGVNGYIKYTGRERDFSLLKGGDLHDNMLVKGEISSVMAEIGRMSIDNEAFGFQVSKATAWHYYVYPLEYDNDITKCRYCVFAVSDPKDIAAVNALITDNPGSPNGDAFEFRGIVMDINYEANERLTHYLWDIYDTDFNIYAHANVRKYIVPYTIYVRSDSAGEIKPIIIGAAMVLVGGVGLIILWVNTYRKNHRF
ncbi:MAG: hypothetical protein K2J77_11130 [Oscillospiraceae bacterium]|nr:hypothetical protein [Oscillospiraceae bacterium]